MLHKLAAPLLLLLLGLASSDLAAAQWMAPLPPLPPLPGMPPMEPMAPMQPFPAMGQMPPGGMSASATAVANGPGQASSFAANNNGQTTRYTQASGSGVATATTANGCQVISQSSSGSCSSGPCCNVAQKVQRCNGFTTAAASVNGIKGQCCIALLKLSDKNIQLFCAAPRGGRDFLQMPASAQVDMKPSCNSNGKPVLACTVSFPKGLPRGYTYPAGYSSKAPLSLLADKAWPGFKPCNAGGKFRRMHQAVSRKKPVTLTSACI
ncbi:hypothetical protein COO60DRAFT_1700475 [Scenedesmus sp. NREL 46B-D3]|nr:hypothetical protein COO60DRAFT_1700475 [Scenedesmus sp. NREL 46B-D3]